jgi:hypothetical protein
VRGQYELQEDGDATQAARDRLVRWVVHSSWRSSRSMGRPCLRTKSTFNLTWDSSGSYRSSGRVGQDDSGTSLLYH